MKAILCCAF